MNRWAALGVALGVVLIVALAIHQFVLLVQRIAALEAMRPVYACFDDEGNEKECLWILPSETLQDVGKRVVKEQ